MTAPWSELRLPEHVVEYLEERAAIREYDGGMPRAEAELEALEDWKRKQARERAQKEATRVD